MTRALLVTQMPVVSHLRLVQARERQDDATLVRSILTGDRSAEETVYRAYAPLVLRLTTRLLGRRVDAEDATQDTFIIAFGNLSQLRDGGSLRPWLLRIAISQARRRFRKRRLLNMLGLHVGADDATLESLAAPGSSAEARADLAALHQVLAKLPAEQRIAWTLRFIEGEQLEDVAHLCRCSLATAKRRIAAADAQVRSQLRIGEDGP